MRVNVVLSIKWREDVLFITREKLEFVAGVMQRQFRIVILCFAVFFVLPVLFTLALRPSFTATALLIIEPAPADIMAATSFDQPAAPNNALVDGAVEIMRSEPVLQRALSLAGPIDAEAFSSSFGFRTRVLAFFGSKPDASEMIATDGPRLLKLARQAVSINRRGLTPVIAISARSVSPGFAARLANGVAEAHMELQWAAKAETLARAQSLIGVQLADARAAVIRAEQAFDLAVTRGKADDEVADLARQLETLRQEQTALEQRLKALGLQAALQMPDARLAAPAAVPIEASFPDTRSVALIAALFATAIALAAAFTADGWTSGVRSTVELAALAGVPLAIAMPRLTTRRNVGRSYADAVVSAPLSPLSEAMRRLQLGLGRSLEKPGGRIVAVMSAGEGEGKTTTALGLARSFALAGQQTLLIDADMRSTALRGHLDVPVSRGFEEVLAGRVALSELSSLVQRDPLSRLNVLVNAGPSALPAEMLFGGALFPAVLQGARTSFDVTILDMPSFRWPADSAHILSHVDGIVLVAGWGRAERASLEDMLVSIRGQQQGRAIAIQPVLSMQPQGLRWPLKLRALNYASR